MAYHDHNGIGLNVHPPAGRQHLCATVGGGDPFHPAQRRTDYRGANYRAAGPTFGRFFMGHVNGTYGKQIPVFLF